MSHHESDARGPNARLVDRVLFFSDAVFAIVLTLLILDLRPPSLLGLRGQAAWSALARVEPHLFAFLLSFGIVGTWWAVHLRVTRNIAMFDWSTAVCNLLFLLVIALMPFVSGLVGQSGWTSPEAFVVYWAANAAASLAMTMLTIVATRDRGRLLIMAMGGGERAFRILQSLAPGLAFGISIWLASHDLLPQSGWPTVLIPIFILSARIFFREPAQKQ